MKGNKTKFDYNCFVFDNLIIKVLQLLKLNETNNELDAITVIATVPILMLVHQC